MNKNAPTIKGIFVKSHVAAVRVKKGDDGVSELEKRFGRQLNFGNNESIPVREEVRLIECVLDVLSDTPVPPETRSYEAGRLHFRNFMTTPLGKILLSVFRNNFKLMMMQAPSIAGHVFEGVTFTAIDMGEHAVRIEMDNNDYPIDHFRGLFAEWMSFSGLTGTVEAKETRPDRYEYMMTWS